MECPLRQQKVKVQLNFSTSKVDTTKVPKVTEAYVAPTAYSEDLMDYVFAYGDAMYKLPVPVSEFLVNGWTIKKEVNGGTIAGDGYGRIGKSVGRLYSQQRGNKKS